MYTGIRFKGYVKPEYRNKIKDIALEGDWENSNIPELKEFGSYSRSSFIPCGALCYMPDEWESDPSKGNYCRTSTGGFERTYNEETGYWTFQCSLKNYENEIEAFFILMPLFIEKIEHLEYFYEECNYSSKYELVDGKVIKVDNKFIKYGHGSENEKWNY